MGTATEGPRPRRRAERSEAANAAYRELQDDGLLDILLGGLLLVFGIAEAMEGVGGPAGVVWLVGLVVLVGGFTLGRRLVTQPRVGPSGGSPELRRRKSRAAVAGALILAAGVALLYVAGADERFFGLERGAGVAIVLGATLFAFFGVLAATLGMPRLWLYAAIYGLPLPTAVLLAIYADVRIHPLLVVGVPALVGVTCGVVLLRRFLRTHPTPAAHESGTGPARM
jgi:hypothetical protein